MKTLWTLLLWIALPCGLGFADEPVAGPKDVPPVVGTAITTSDSEAWSVQLMVPTVNWKVVGEQQPKREWPKLEVDVAEAVLKLSLDYDAATQLSEDSQKRIVDLKGRRLNRDEVEARLKERTPVLISVSGRMPDAFYLQCTKADTLIVILGLQDSPAPHLLPRDATGDDPNKK